jgi:hypothetical protein
MTLKDIRTQIADIDNHVEAIAAGTGTETSVLAFAVHNVCRALHDLTDEVEKLQRKA